jgi:hypothetical protein
MGMTVSQSWKLRSKAVNRPRTYAQALAIYECSAQIAESTKSLKGGFHRSLGVEKVRQYPLKVPGRWSNTYVGMLPATTNGSSLDPMMYSNNSQVPDGRIAFYYAPHGYMVRDSIELVLWLPDGRCLINPEVIAPFHGNRCERAEAFADIAMWRGRRGNYIRTARDARGFIPHDWKSVEVTYADSEAHGPGAHAVWVREELEKGRPVYLRKESLYGAYLMRSRPSNAVVIPKRRNERPYYLRGDVDRLPGADHRLNEARLDSWAELRAEARKRTAVYRRMNGLMRTLYASPDMMRYFVDHYGHEFLARDVRATRTMHGTPTMDGSWVGGVSPTEQQPRASITFLEAGTRHDRHIQLDEEEETL